MYETPAEYEDAVEVFDAKTVAEICQFRVRVWSAIGHLVEGAFAADGWRDPIDAVCRHWIIRRGDGRLVAAGRLSLHERLEQVHQAQEYLRYGVVANGTVAAPDRVVVCPSAQNEGLGRQILDVQDQASRQSGAVLAVRQASPSMVRLLKHRGWQILGRASADPRFKGVDFYVAVLRITPSLDARSRVEAA
jgi:hypothetical protein